MRVYINPSFRTLRHALKKKPLRWKDITLPTNPAPPPLPLLYATVNMRKVRQAV